MMMIWCCVLAVAGFFHTATSADGKACFVDADGREVFVRSCNTVNIAGPWCASLNKHPYREAVNRIFPTEEAWAEDAAKCLRKWGFNTIGGNSNTSVFHRVGLYHERILHLGRDFTGKKVNGPVLCGSFPDVFSPAFEKWIVREARQRCAPSRDDRALVGYEIDNELPWNALAALKPDDPDYTRRVAERYFSICASAIRRADPNHLLLGCRFAGMSGASPEVYAVCGKYCEVVSFNCYPAANIDEQAVWVNTGRGVLPSQEAFARASAWSGGRPILVTEWTYEALDSGLSNSRGGGMRLFTQTDRVRAARLFATCMLTSPHVVGYSFFKWTDQPETGYFEDINCGLFTIDAKPYVLLTDMFSNLHAQADAVRRGPSPVRRKVAPPEPKRLTEYLRETPPVAGRFSFEKSESGAFEASNDVGFRLTGSLGGSPSNVLFTIGLADRSLARVDFMLSVTNAAGRAGWNLADRIHAVSWREETGCGILRLDVSGRAFAAVCEVLVYPGRPRAVLSVVSVRNRSSQPVLGDRLFVRTQPLFVPRAKKFPIGLYRPLPDIVLQEQEGKAELALHVPVSTLVKQEFHADGKKSSRGETAFRPLKNLYLRPGQIQPLDGTVWMVFESTRSDAL